MTASRGVRSDGSICRSPLSKINALRLIHSQRGILCRTSLVAYNINNPLKVRANSIRKQEEEEEEEEQEEIITMITNGWVALQSIYDSTSDPSSRVNVSSRSGNLLL